MYVPAAGILAGTIGLIILGVGIVVLLLLAVRGGSMKDAETARLWEEKNRHENRRPDNS